MEVGSCGPSGGASKCDYSVRADFFAGRDHVLAVMCVKGYRSIFMIDDDDISITVSITAVGYDAGRNWSDGSSFGNCYIDSMVVF